VPDLSSAAWIEIELRDQEVDCSPAEASQTNTDPAIGSHRNQKNAYPAALAISFNFNIRQVILITRWQVTVTELLGIVCVLVSGRPPTLPSF
jgi:hypothetical protein